MIHLREISVEDQAYPFVEQLLLTSFPESERRDIAEQRRNIAENPLMHCLLAEDDESPIGFLTYWDFGSFCYGEHFATDTTLRNKGYGGQIIRAVLAKLQRPFVLEVEMPEDDLSKRRIGFYERNGLTLWRDYGYTQPPYKEGGESLPLLLMATDGLSPEQDFQRVVYQMYKHVYSVPADQIDHFLNEPLRIY